MVTQNYRDPSDGLFKSLPAYFSDEVHVGPNPPTDPNIEWWIDTDDTTGQGIALVDADARYMPKAANVQTGFRNYIRNGDMQVAQRGNGPWTANAVYCVDGWGTNSASTNTSISRVVQAAGLGSPFLRTVTTSQTASDIAAVYAIIEDVSSLAGKQATISFDASAASGTPKICLETYQNFGSGGSTAVNTVYGTVTISTTKTRYSFTVTIPSIVGKTVGANNYLMFRFWFSHNNTGVYLIGLQNNTFNITDVQLEEGTQATPFERLPQQQQLAWCQRYFWRMSSQGANWFRFGSGVVRAGTIADVTIPYPVTMRITPVITFSAASTFGAWDGTASGACSAITVGDAVNNIAANIFGTWSGLTTQGRGAMLAANATATAYIDFSAEL